MIKKIIATFDNSTPGFSARKLSAFLAVMLSTGITVFKANSENVVELVAIWLSFALLSLGIITMQQVIEFKNGKGKNTQET